MEQAAATAPPSPAPEAPKKLKSILAVPEEIQATWASVDIEVTNKESGASDIYTLARDDETLIEGSRMTFSVTHFIPHFTMGEGVMTSIDANPENPSVGIRVLGPDGVLWENAIFLNYPDAHAFTHPKYSIIFKKFTPKDVK